MSARGGKRAPDGKARPASLPFARGTPLPPNPAEPQIEHGQAGSLRQQLSGIPLQTQSFAPVSLTEPSQRPNEPVTTGVDMGAGPGSESLIPSPVQTGNMDAVKESLFFYPVLARLAQLPSATTQTKILAQRLRGMAPVAPERMPNLGV